MTPCANAAPARDNDPELARAPGLGFSDADPKNEMRLAAPARVAREARHCRIETTPTFGHIGVIMWASIPCE